MLNNREGQLVAEVAPHPTAVAAGILTAAAGTVLINPPKIAQRLYYWIKHSNLTLTNPDAKQAFELFYQGVCDIRNTTDCTYPEKLENCLVQFENQLSTENAVYKFDPLQSFNIKEIFNKFGEGSLMIHGKKISHDALTGAVINAVCTLKCMEVNATLGVPKLIVSFLVAMSIEFASTANTVEKRDLVRLMSQVAGLVMADGKIRQLFSADTFSVLQTLIEIFSRYLGNIYHLADAEAIFIASKDFKQAQVGLSREIFRLLLTLTEGGKNELISLDYAKIAKGDLSLGTSAIVSFSATNPLANVLMNCALLFPSQDESYNLETDMSSLQIPDRGRIVSFVKASLNEAASLTLRAPILYPLLKSRVLRENITEQSFISIKDDSNITLASNYLYQLAEWLKRHVVLGQIACTFDIATQYKGQEWLEGYSQFIQKFMVNYDALLSTEFTSLLNNLKKHIEERLDKSGDHDVIKIINAIFSNINTLQKKGIEPLKQFTAYRLKTTSVIKNIDNKLQSFFGTTPTHLRSIGISIDMPSPSMGGDARLFDPIIYDGIITILTDYAKDKDRQYKFRLPHLPAEITLLPTDASPGEFVYKTARLPLGQNQKSKARAQLFYTLLTIIQSKNREDIDKLHAIQDTITGCLTAQADLFSSTQEHGITRTLLHILQMIHKKLYAELLEAKIPRVIVNAAATSHFSKAEHKESLFERPEDRKEALQRHSSNDQKQIGNPMKKRNTLASNLKTIIDWVAATPAHHEAFQTFWSHLLYLNDKSGYIYGQSDRSKMEAYHQNCLLTEKARQSQLAHYMQLNTALNSGNPCAIEWVKLEIKQIAQDNNAKACHTTDEIQVILNEKIEDLKNNLIQLTEIATHYQKHQFFLDKTPNTGQTHTTKATAWTQERTNTLGRDLQQYADQAGVTDNTTLMLQSIAARLLQTDVIDADVETEFNELLSTSIIEFLKSEPKSPSRQYWIVIIQGLLMLGASPVKWIDKGLENNTDTAQNNLDVTLIFEQLSMILLSHLVNRSKHQGDSAVHLGDGLSTLINATHQFVTALKSSVKENFYFKTLVDLLSSPIRGKSAGFREGAIAAQHRNDRALLYWSVIKLIYVILNDSLDAQDAAQKISDRKLTAAEQKYSELKNLCQGKMRKRGWFEWLFNSGHPGFNEFVALTQAAQKITEKLDNFASRRVLRMSIEENIKTAESNKQFTKEREETDAQRNEIQGQRDEMREKHDEMQNQLYTATLDFINMSIDDAIEAGRENINPTRMMDLKQSILKKMSRAFTKTSPEALSKRIDDCFTERSLVPSSAPIHSANPSGMFTAAQSAENGKSIQITATQATK